MSARDVTAWVPAFPGQRPPFEPGHTMSLHHGVYSPRTVDPLAVEIRSSVLGDPATEYLVAPRYAPALWAWARAEAQVQLLTEYLTKLAEDAGAALADLGAKRVTAAYRELHRAETRAASGRRALGLDPLSAARLGKDRAAQHLDAARLMAELHRQEQERLSREVEGQVDGGAGS